MPATRGRAGRSRGWDEYLGCETVMTYAVLPDATASFAQRSAGPCGGAAQQPPADTAQHALAVIAVDIADDSSKNNTPS